MFILDSNVFIEAKNRYYGFDFAPGFWDWLECTQQQSQICSLEAVRKELEARQDELSKWAVRNKPLFRKLDQKSAGVFPALTSWAKGQNYSQSAIAKFANNYADYELIAYAKAHPLVLGTHDKSGPNSRTSIKIPDACRAMGVKVVDTFQMLRSASARLILA